MRLYAEHVRLNRGGYDRRGRYWGSGEKLYRVYDEVGAINVYLRAPSSEAAREQVATAYSAFRARPSSINPETGEPLPFRQSHLEQALRQGDWGSSDREAIYMARSGQQMAIADFENGRPGYHRNVSNSPAYRSAYDSRLDHLKRKAGGGMQGLGAVDQDQVQIVQEQYRPHLHETFYFVKVGAHSVEVVVSEQSGAYHIKNLSRGKGWASAADRASRAVRRHRQSKGMTYGLGAVGQEHCSQGLRLVHVPSHRVWVFKNNRGLAMFVGARDQFPTRAAAVSAAERIGLVVDGRGCVSQHPVTAQDVTGWPAGQGNW